MIEKLPGKKLAKFRGTFDALSTFEIPEQGLQELITERSMASVSGERTQATDLDFGLEVLNGFMKGFGANIPRLDVHFKEVSKVSFSFENIVRYWIDNNLLGRDLKEIVVDKNLPSAAGFFGPNKSRLLFIDSIITSNDFSIHAEESNSDQVNFEAAAIQEELANIGLDIKVTSSNKTSITFKGQKTLPFAYTTLELILDDEGRILRMPPYISSSMVTMRGNDSGQEFEKTKLSEKLALVDLDFSEE